MWEGYSWVLLVAWVVSFLPPTLQKSPRNRLGVHVDFAVGDPPTRPCGKADFCVADGGSYFIGS